MLKSRLFPSLSTSTVSPLSGLLISTRSPGTKLTTFSWSGLSASLVEIEMKSSSTSMLVMIVASLIDSISSLGTSATEDRVLASKSQSNTSLSPYASRTSSSPSWSWCFNLNLLIKVFQFTICLTVANMMNLLGTNLPDTNGKSISGSKW